MTRLKKRKDLHGTPEDVRFGTPKEVAEYRAERLQADTIVEIGAGAGFQTSAFAEHAKKVVAVEIDGEKLGRAALPDNAVPIVGDALDPAIVAQVQEQCEGRVVVFLDPERPPAAARRTLAEIQPNIAAFLQLYDKITKDIAIEFPPFLEDLPDGEREYISLDGELNRLTVYMGDLSTCDLSVVKLPERDRLTHSGPLPESRERKCVPTHVLVPDKAVVRAGLLPLVLPKQYVNLGRGYGTTTPGDVWSTTYKVLHTGTKEEIVSSLSEQNCGTIILHGTFTQEEQRELLRELNQHCRGEKRLHLFADTLWVLARK